MRTSKTYLHMNYRYNTSGKAWGTLQPTIGKIDTLKSKKPARFSLPKMLKGIRWTKGKYWNTRKAFDAARYFSFSTVSTFQFWVYMSDVPTKMASFLKHSQINASSYLYGSNLHVCVFYAGIVFNCYTHLPQQNLILHKIMQQEQIYIIKTECRKVWLSKSVSVCSREWKLLQLLLKSDDNKWSTIMV